MWTSSFGYTIISRHLDKSEIMETMSLQLAHKQLRVDRPWLRTNYPIHPKTALTFLIPPALDDKWLLVYQPKKIKKKSSSSSSSSSPTASIISVFEISTSSPVPSKHSVPVLDSTRVTHMVSTNLNYVIALNHMAKYCYSGYYDWTTMKHSILNLGDTDRCYMLANIVLLDFLERIALGPRIYFRYDVFYDFVTQRATIDSLWNIHGAVETLICHVVLPFLVVGQLLFGIPLDTMISTLMRMFPVFTTTHSFLVCQEVRQFYIGCYEIFFGHRRVRHGLLVIDEKARKAAAKRKKKQLQQQQVTVEEDLEEDYPTMLMRDDEHIMRHLVAYIKSKRTHFKTTYYL